MSNTPGISPITPDIEEIRHADEDGFFGEDQNSGPAEDADEGDQEEQSIIEDDRSGTSNS
ncbi:hypothetical protein GCM10011390_44100 [Aureimonas endophytica]|uniref:Uncharacterized protein n=1 Tax=Aureimonas endophytica TaxID=2027858 RepID=A0A917A0I2_9HYPH|nr:hypothetical protein [Aureimonas endophytica]GGE20015.1 hypothetical protein GCM10011390_44100 [Aureimonas endophytica]